MDKHTIASGPNPKVILEVDGDLTLKGWEEPEVVAKSSSTEDLRIDQRDDAVHIHCNRDCLVRVPLEARVEIRRASGQAMIKSLEGDLEIAQVDGELILRSVGPVKIGRASGNLTAKNVSGSLTIRRVHGNVTLRDVEGDFLVEESVDGNLSIKEIDGNVKVTAYGNVTASLDPSPGSNSELTAHGNLVCRLPEDAGVKVHISSGFPIQVKFPGVQSGSDLNAPYDLTLGEGEAGLTLSARGNILLKALPADWDVDLYEHELEFDPLEDFAGISASLNEQITRQVEGQIEFIQEQLESQLENLSNRLSSTGLTAEHAEHIARHAREAGERARVRAEERIQRAQEKIERKLEAARRRAEQRARAAERAARDRRRRPEPPDWAAPPRPLVPPGPPVEPVTEEERLMVLQLLEQGKITMDEAEQLLAALEGKTA
jgi:hypothetical protein